MFTQDCNFIFVPVDKDFKSLIQDIEISETPFPSETDLKNVAGFLMIPAFWTPKKFYLAHGCLPRISTEPVLEEISFSLLGQKTTG